MENESQKRRTYDIITKFIGQTNGITINMEPDAPVMVDIKSKTITIPSNVQAKNIYPVIAWLMHEAAHIKHTIFDTAKLVDDKDEFMILNCIEDIRIDNMNFRILPNIHGLYEEMVKFVTSKVSNRPPEAEVLCDAIFELENFSRYRSRKPESDAVLHNTPILKHIQRVVCLLHDIERRIIQRFADNISAMPKLYAEAKQLIKNIKDILFKHKQQQQKQQASDPQQPCNGGKGASNAQGQNPNGQAHAPAGMGDKLDLSDANGVSGGGNSQALFGELDANATGQPTLGQAALNECTRSSFKELLNIKERVTQSDGTRLDTDNLTAFFTGDVDDLFIEDSHVKRRKSKILFLMDRSGSMSCPPLDNNAESKMTILLRTVAGVVDIIKEVQLMDGLDVDFDLMTFDDSTDVIHEDKLALVHPRGGTDLKGAFSEAQQHMLSDYTIEGNRIILAVTDGEVSDSDLEEISEMIQTTGSQIKCLIIGIGADINGGFIKKVSGHNILDKKYADVVLMEALQELLSY